MLLVKKELKLWIFWKESKNSCRTSSSVLKDDYLVLYSPLLRAWKSSVNILPTLSVFSFWKSLKILNIPLTVFSYWKSRKSSGKILLPCLYSLYRKSLKMFRKDLPTFVCILYTGRAWKSSWKILLPTLYSLYRKSLKMLRKDPLTLDVFYIPEEPENLQ